MWNLLYIFRLIVFILGFISFFVSYRYLQDNRTLFLVISFILMGLGLLITGVFICRSSKLQEYKSESKKSLIYVLGWKLLIVFACLMYLVYIDFLEASGGNFGIIEKLSLGAWILLGIWGILLGIGVELATCGAGRAFDTTKIVRKYFDLTRIKKALSYYSSIALVLGICICLCYGASKRNKTFDLSYLKIATPSSETVSYLESHPQIKVEAYFANDNEVRYYVEKYFSLISSKLPGISVEYIDLDSSPAKANERDISKNGFVVFVDSSKDKINKFYVNDEIAASKKILRNFDKEVQTHLKELIEKSKTIYLTTSHLEYSIKEEGKNPFKSFKSLSKIFSQINYNVKTLNTQELISGVPEDASCLMIVSAKSSFLSQEISSIDKYLNQGGCLVAFLDSIGGSDGKVVSASNGITEYLKSKGLVYNKVVLGNAVNHVQLFHSPVDNWFLATNNYSKHPTMETLLALRQQAILLMFGSGYFSFVPSKEGWGYSSLVKTLPATFIDKNLNYKQDTGETGDSQVFDLIVASSKPVAGNKQDSSDDGKKESRMVLFSNSSITSDALIGNTANRIMVLEAFKWGFQDETMFTSSSSEEDVKIQHTREENIIWFNLTVFGIPVLILLIGFIVLRVMRRKQ